MIIRILLLALFLTGFNISATADNDLHAKVLEIATQFNEAAKQRISIDWGARYMHPTVTKTISGYLGISTEEFLQRTREGYTTANETFTLVSHMILKEKSKFGELHGWRWGAVPYKSELAFRENEDSIISNCSWLFVFEDDGSWYFNSVYSGSARTRALMLRSLPAPLPLVVDQLGEPNCR